ncbi:Bug family tripartite tricarboxylate transporter substrate binding protein [Arenivirga flava]|uniref:C4-dicarboxylate ABC transporter substrate-binding protein n=1 Tax=Arenivirga flava TaxID=1930060 RepID=A0AA37XB54_9MICO|nr:tripartite tricarboxylate transporter substrate-binding protein [Arenivirga flava]GMA28348.1 C4-dicarboxylate ABC transporter substrate-binding protein [Arenivirga flava]
MRRRIPLILFSAASAAVFGLAAVDASGGGAGATPRTALTLVAPAAPGGGWDAFAREAQQVIRDEGASSTVQVVNVPGAAGTIGLGQVAQMGDRHDIMLVTGTVMIGGVAMATSGETLEHTTPIARIADDYAVLVVPADSPYETLDDFVAAWQEDPGGTAIAGGSLGGIDHLVAGLAGAEVGIDPRDVNYIAYPGGGEVVSSMLSNSAAAGISGLNEFRDQIEVGNIRALAVSAEEPQEGLGIPTFREAGVDVAMSNWRGLVAPPDISDETRAELIAIVEEMQASDAWRATLDRNNWTDSMLVGDEFGAFLEAESTRIETIIEELGL